MAKDKGKPKALRAVPPTGGEPLTPEQQQLQALGQQLQATRTELAVLKQMYAEVSVQARIAMSEREQLLQQAQRSQQVIEKLTADLQKATAPPVQTATAPPAEPADEEEEEEED